MITYEVEGYDELIKRLRQKVRVYKIYKRRVISAASKLGLKITEDKWYGIDDGISVTLSMSDNGFIISVSGTEVLFLEFGAGKTYENSVHPLAKKLGYGPGTYDGKGYWDSPTGWYYYSNDPTKVVMMNPHTKQGVAHTWGNPAWGATYKSAETMRQEFTAMVIKELTRK